MARRSLKPQLNQIRTWAREGRTNAWIAHQLEVSPKDIESFKHEHGLAPDESSSEAGTGPVVEEERDMRAEDDALVAAELDAMDDEPPEEEEEDDAAEGDDSSADGGASAEDEGDGERRPRRRGRRGGRRRRGTRERRPLEGTFDHGEEGYGLWLDPAVQDDGVYAEHWAGHRPVLVAVEPDRIVIRRRDADGDGE